MAIDQEQTTRLLARTLVHSGEVLAQVAHSHLSRALRDAVEDLLRIAFSDSDNREAVLAAAQRLRMSLEDISIVSGAPLGALLLAERHVLLLQLHLSAERIQSPRTRGAAASTTPTPRVMTSRPRVSANIRESLDQVLGYVRVSGPSQARDIIAGCIPALSERTVKRRIKDLVKSGQLRKEEDDGVLLYRATA